MTVLDVAMMGADADDGRARGWAARALSGGGRRESSSRLMPVVVSEMSAAVSTLRVMMVIIMAALADLPTPCGMMTVAITTTCAVLSILGGGEGRGEGGGSQSVV